MDETKTRNNSDGRELAPEAMSTFTFGSLTSPFGTIAVRPVMSLARALFCSEVSAQSNQESDAHLIRRTLKFLSSNAYIAGHLSCDKLSLTSALFLSNAELTASEVLILLGHLGLPWNTAMLQTQLPSAVQYAVDQEKLSAKSRRIVEAIPNLSCYYQPGFGSMTGEILPTKN